MIEPKAAELRVTQHGVVESRPRYEDGSPAFAALHLGDVCILCRRGRRVGA